MKKRVRLFVAPFLVIPFVLVLVLPALGKQHTTHAEIVAEIQDHLYHAQVFKHGDVHVEYQDGVATLTGSVDRIGVKMDAQRAALKVDDVQSVVNQITVNPGDAGPEGILRQARKEILTYPFYTIFDHIVLRAQGTALTVNGEVTQPYKKSDIGNFLEHIQGVTAFTNDLKVLPVSNFDDQLRLSIARAIYNDPIFINYGNQAHPPIHIIVDNGNVTLYGAVDSEVGRAAAERDARFAGTYFSLKNDLRVEKG